MIRKRIRAIEIRLQNIGLFDLLHIHGFIIAGNGVLGVIVMNRPFHGFVVLQLVIRNLQFAGMQPEHGIRNLHAAQLGIVGAHAENGTAQNGRNGPVNLFIAGF